MNKIFFCDIDDTLVGKNKSISKKNFKSAIFCVLKCKNCTLIIDIRFNNWYNIHVGGISNG